MHRSARPTHLAMSAIAAPVFACSFSMAQSLEWEVLRPTNTGLLGDYVNAILLDESERPWIAAYTPFWEQGGMSRYNGDDQPWSVVSSDNHDIIISPRFNDIVRDQAGIIWIGSDQGMYRFDPVAGPESLMRFDTGNSPMLGNRVNDIAVAPDGTIWLAMDTFGGGTAGGLAQFDPATQTWNTWGPPMAIECFPAVPWTIAHVAIVPGPVAGWGGDYQVWFNHTSVAGVGMLEVGQAGPGEITWTCVSSPPPAQPALAAIAGDHAVDENGSIWMNLLPGDLGRLDSDGTLTVTGYPFGLDTEIQAITALSGGRALVGTAYADVFLWDNGWTHLGDWGGTHTNAFAEIQTNKDGDLSFWVGGIGGSARYENGAFQRYRLTNTGMVGFFMRTIAFGHDGSVYMNGNAGPGVGGLCILSPDGTWTNANVATYGLGLSWPYNTDNVSDAFARANGDVMFIPSGSGLRQLDGSQFTTLIPDPYNLKEVVEDTLGRVWAIRGYGLDLIDTDGNWSSFFPSNSPIGNGDARSLTIDHLNPGFVWIVKHTRAIHTNGETWEFFHRDQIVAPLPGNSGTGLECMTLDEDGTLWIGVTGPTLAGLYHYDPVANTSVRYHTGNSAMLVNDVVKVELAPDGSVWIATGNVGDSDPSGLTHFVDGMSASYHEGNSPLLSDQIAVLNTRTVPGGYELWVGTASSGINIVTVSTQTPLPADISGDGEVGVADLLAVIQAWGPCPEAPANCTADIAPAGAPDGLVGVADLLMVISNWS